MPYVRSLWTGIMEPRQGLGEYPTTVSLRDGSHYTIPSGPWGSAAWWRQASLIALAYRQLGDAAEADRWSREADRRRQIWDALQAGADRAAVLRQFGADLLLAPLRIAVDVGGAVVTTAAGATKGALGVAQALPLLGVLALVALTVGLWRGTVRV